MWKKSLTPLVTLTWLKSFSLLEKHRASKAILPVLGESVSVLPDQPEALNSLCKCKLHLQVCFGRPLFLLPCSPLERLPGDIAGLLHLTWPSSLIEKHIGPPKQPSNFFCPWHGSLHPPRSGQKLSIPSIGFSYRSALSAISSSCPVDSLEHLPDDVAGPFP